MEILEKRIKVTDLLPQQPPFVMIDELLFIDEQSIITKLEIEADNIFVNEKGFFTEAGIVENIAQTGAARMGYVNKYINKEEVKIGFIGEIKNLTIQKLPQSGDVLNTRVVITNEVLSTLLVKADVTNQHNELICECGMKISMTEIVSPSVNYA